MYKEPGPIYQLYKLLTDVPFNIWFWLFFIVLPVLVFYKKPHHSYGKRFIVFLAAIGFGYVMVNLAIGTSFELQFKEVQACRIANNGTDMQPHPDCPEYNIADGAAMLFAFVFGWIHAASYMGMWEFFWWRKHRHTLREMGSAYEGRWMSNFCYVFAIVTLLFLSLILGGFLFHALSS